MLLGFVFGDGRQTLRRPRGRRRGRAGDVGHDHEHDLEPRSRLHQLKGPPQLHSIVGITEIAHETVLAGAGYAFVFLGFISLILAVINLFPFLPLDGGHILWAVAEKVRGRRISLTAMYRFSSVGIVLLVFLVINGISNDISRLAAERAAALRHPALRRAAPNRSGASAGPEERLQLARRSSEISSQSPGRAEPQ